MVVTIGIDVHQQTHCAVAVDEVGRPVGKPVTVRATDAGHRQLLRWARRACAEGRVEFAVEDCRHVSTRLEQALLAAGAVVLRVPPKLVAQTRSSARTRGKSDPIDALAIARAALREPNLPRAEHSHASRELKLLPCLPPAPTRATRHQGRSPARPRATPRPGRVPQLRPTNQPATAAPPQAA